MGLFRVIGSWRTASIFISLLYMIAFTELSFAQALVNRTPNLGPHCFEGMYYPQRVWNDTGIACLRGQYGQCISALSNVRRGRYKNECRFGFLISLANIEIRKGQNAAAEKEARRAMKLFNNYKAAYILTLALANQGKYDEAIKYGQLVLGSDIPESVRKQLKTVISIQKERKRYAEQQRALAQKRRVEKRAEAERNARKGIDRAIREVRSQKQSEGFCLWSCPPTHNAIYSAARDMLKKQYPQWKIRALAKVDGQMTKFGGADFYVAEVAYVIQTEQGINVDCHKSAGNRGDLSCPFRIMTQGAYLPGSWKYGKVRISFQRTERG